MKVRSVRGGMEMTLMTTAMKIMTRTAMIMTMMMVTKTILTMKIFFRYSFML